MNIKFEKIDDISTSNHLLILCSADNLQDTSYLSELELNYLNEKLIKKEYFVAINQYFRYVFYLLYDGSKSESIATEEIRKNAYKVQSYIADSKITNIEIIDKFDKKQVVLSIFEGIALGAYRFNKYLKNADEKDCKIKEISVVSKSVENKDLQSLSNVIKAIYYARTLINEPVNVLNAEALADEIQKMALESGCEVEVFNKSKIESLKMGGLIAVNKGSVDPPTFTVLEWKPANAINSKPYVLVGKGVVYDTGGLSLKPTSDSMDYMKSDMSGAATVAALMYAVSRNKLPLHIVALIPSTDNRPSGNAYAPGDVITMMDGTTVEMLNADAEGRMILADAITYSKRYEPQLLFTVATLTGAAAAAIGEFAMVTMGNADSNIKNELQISADHTFERIAEFPFWDDYAKEIKSDIADIKNIGGKFAGAITAGKFLEHFTSCPFMHFDIAGVAYSKKNDSYKGKGGTAFGVRMLYNFFFNIANNNNK